MAAGAGGELLTLAQLNAWVDSRIDPKPPANPPIRAGTIRARPASVADEFMIRPEDYWRRKVYSKNSKPQPLPASLQLRPGVAFDLDAFKVATGLDNYKQVDNTGCGNNDCLIISFLTSINQNYRRATYDQQCAIAREFRTRELIRLPVFLERVASLGAQDRNQARRGIRSNMRQEFLDIVQSKEYLDHRVIGILADQYSISILNFESYKTDNYPGIGQVAAPPYSSLVTKEENGATVSENGIIIYNLGGGHFQSVFRLPEARPTFIFPTEELQMLQLAVQEAIPFVRREDTQGVAGYAPGTEVRLDGDPNTRYWVKGRYQRDNIMPGELPQIRDYTITPIEEQAFQGASHPSNMPKIAPGRISLPREEAAVDPNVETAAALGMSVNNYKRALQNQRAANARAAAAPPSRPPAPPSRPAAAPPPAPRSQKRQVNTSAVNSAPPPLSRPPGSQVAEFVRKKRAVLNAIKGYAGASSPAMGNIGRELQSSLNSAARIALLRRTAKSIGMSNNNALVMKFNMTAGGRRKTKKQRKANRRSRTRKA